MPKHTFEEAQAIKIHRSERKCQLIKARIMRDKLGIKDAAEYLRDRGWSLEACKWVLLRT